MKKRFLAFMLSLAMVFSLLPMAAYAEDDVTSSIETTETQLDIQTEAPDGTTTESDNEQPPAEAPAPETSTPTSATVNAGEYTAKVTIGGRTATANFKIKPVATTTVNFTTDLTTITDMVALFAITLLF